MGARAQTRGARTQGRLMAASRGQANEPPAGHLISYKSPLIFRRIFLSSSSPQDSLRPRPVVVVAPSVPPPPHTRATLPFALAVKPRLLEVIVLPCRPRTVKILSPVILSPSPTRPAGERVSSLAPTLTMPAAKSSRSSSSPVKSTMHGTPL